MEDYKINEVSRHPDAACQSMLTQAQPVKKIRKRIQNTLGRYQRCGSKQVGLLFLLFL